MDRRILGTAMTIAAFVAGCQFVMRPIKPDTLFFPQRPDPAAHEPKLTALSGGTLVEDAGCLWLASPTERRLLIWLSSHRVLRSERGTTITDASGNDLAQVGDAVVVSGGEFRDSPGADASVDTWVETLIGQSVPQPCRRGLYFLLGGISRERA